MKLKTQITPTKTRIDIPSKIQLSDNILSVYFSTHLKIGEDLLESSLDINPVVIPITQSISELIATIFTEALEARKLQLSSNNSTIEEKPNYKRFYSELLTTELFSIARYSAGENLQACIAYSDFALALTNSIAGNENSIALQICLNNMIEVLEDKINSNILNDLKELIERNNLPITIE